MKMYHTKKYCIFALALMQAGISFAQLRPLNERRDVPRGKWQHEKQVQQEEDDSLEFLDMVDFADTRKTATFIIGDDSVPYSTKRNLSPYKMNRYETTYGLWYKVRVWAEENGYIFENPGQEGSRGLRGKPPTAYSSSEPVTTISWYDVIVWCNALSEMTGRKPCYTYRNSVLRDSTDTAYCDLAKCSFDSNGYRLPTEAEWEFAARSTVNGLQSSALVPGQVDENGTDDESVEPESLAWLSSNSDRTRRVGTAGIDYGETLQPESGSGNPNGAGLFDMGGNVMEWCFDWLEPYAANSGRRYAGPEFGEERIMRGGSVNEYTLFCTAGDRYSYNPDEAYSYFGFRIACSK